LYGNLDKEMRFAGAYPSVQRFPELGDRRLVQVSFVWVDLNQSLVLIFAKKK
jgi:hypothetical protein